ncbi:ComEC/Rec2 family competence protein [Cellulomonas sp.]|uniref:ComEC/Rec2 family competence protein n=1 Tax=Cellulomonas sp. TaxID=40001 RepID=UPI001B294AE2|nr:ComEC/Rec2 family competence protein [Cellulomonas sp.]MBO9555193.1 ComEC/Rec2 family competence protein [Cellulomonas sp.]
MAPPSIGAAVALAVVAAVAVLVSGAAQVDARLSGVLPSLADAGAVGTVVGVVDGDARILPPAWPGAAARACVTLAAARVVGAGRSGAATGPVAVLGPVSWAAAPFGARVEVTGRLADASGGRDVALLTTAQDPVVVAPPAPWHAAAARVRAHVVDLAGTLPGDAGALLPGVTVGDTTRVPVDLVAAMRTAGLTHVMAVSGAHFALVAGLVLAICTGIGVPRRVRALTVVASTVALVVLVHPAPSVLRAALMGTVGALGLVVGRPARAPAALAATVVVLLVVDPWLGSELGFVLSVLATAGLVLLGGPLAERWSTRAGRPLATALAVPVAAQLVCAPVLLLVSPTVAPLAVPANILVAPAVGPATVLGLAAGLLDGVWPTGAHLLATGAGAACWWIGAVARVTAGAPLAQVAWASGPLGVALLAVCGVCVARLLLPPRARRAAVRRASAPCPPAAAPDAEAARHVGAAAPDGGCR